MWKNWWAMAFWYWSNSNTEKEKNRYVLKSHMVIFCICDIPESISKLILILSYDKGILLNFKLDYRIL